MRPVAAGALPRLQMQAEENDNENPSLHLLQRLFRRVAK
jgi:hypothetical protein